MKCLDVQNNVIVVLDSNYNVIEERKYNGDKFEYFISLPWIDSHVHCNPNHPYIKGRPDDFGVNQGVGYIFDAGSTGIENFNLWNNVLESNDTRINILLNVSKKGIIQNGELKNLDNFVSIDNVREKLKNISGIKLRLSSSTNGFHEETLKRSLEFSKELDIPLMIHVGNSPPRMEYLLKKVDKRTVITHCFNGKSNNLLNSTKLIDILKSKIQDGVKLDIGHGSESFSFKIAKKAFENKIEPFSISTDMYINNFDGPVFSLASVMSKLLYVGYTKEKILDLVTKNPAKLFKIKDYPKSLNEGFTLFKIIEKELIVEDAFKNQTSNKTKIKKLFVPIILKHNKKIFKVKEETLYGKLL